MTSTAARRHSLVTTWRRYLWVMLGFAWLSAAGFTGYAAFSDTKKAERQMVERQQAGKRVSYKTFNRIYYPRASLGVGIFFLLLTAAVPWLWPRLQWPDIADEKNPDGERPPPPLKHSPRWFWWGLTALTVFCALANGPRLHHSVWGDEEATLRRFVAGHWERAEPQLDPQSPLRHEPVPWSETFFDYKDPNNHLLFSVLARLSHTAFGKKVTETSGAYFSEWAFRLPAFIAGLAGLWMIALAVRRWAGSQGEKLALMAAVIYSLHPWYVRYSTEARGYGLLLLLIPALWWTAERAVRTRAAWPWVLMGVLECLLLLTYPLALHMLIALHVGLWVVMYQQRNAGGRVLFYRWLVTQAIAAVITVALFLPHAMQLRLYLQRERVQGNIAQPGLLTDLGSMLFTGLPWRDVDKANELLMNWTRWVGAGWRLEAAIAIASVLIFFTGVVTWWRRGGSHRGWVLALTLTAPSLLAHSFLAETILYSWYLMIAWPGLAVLTAVGIMKVIAWANQQKIALMSWLLAGASVLAYARMARPVREVLRAKSLEPNREATLLVQTALHPQHPDYHREVLTATFLMQIEAYDPGAFFFQTADELQQLIAHAKNRGKKLAVIFGQYALAMERFPEVMKLINDEQLFEKVAVLPGQETYCTRFVYRTR